MRFVSGEGSAPVTQREGEYPAATPLFLSSLHAPWLAPVAVVSSAIASGVVSARPDWLLSLAMAVLLALAWIVAWSVIAGVNWSAPLAVWQGWTEGVPLGALPYAQPGSDAAYLSRRLGQLRSWLGRDFLPRYGNLLLAGAMAIAVVAVLSAALGPSAVLLTIVAACIVQIAVVACRGNGQPNGLLLGAMAVGLPMLLGYAIFVPLSPGILLMGSSVAAAFAGVRDERPALRHAGYTLAVLASLVMREPVGAFAWAVLWAPQLILGLRRGGYGWLAAGLLVFAVVM